MSRKPIYLFACMLVQLVLHCRGDLPPPDILARMEDKVMSAVSLKSLEALVEKDKSVQNVKSRLLSNIPEHMLGGRVVIASDGEAFYDPEPLPSEAVFDGRRESKPISRENQDADSIERFIVIESADGDKDTEHGTGSAKLTAEESRAVQHFVEALAEEIATEMPIIIKPSRMDASASENVPSYKPRFDYDSYSKDSTDTKLNGKTYWRDSDHSDDADARSDGKGCTMVVKKFRDPEDHKHSKDGSPVKSVLVTKECVYPDGRGPDASIPVASSQSRQPLHVFQEKPKVRVVSYEKHSVPVYDESVRSPDLPAYSSAPESKEYSRDPLKSDYIDRMLEEHFKVFPNFRTTTTAIEELERKLKSELRDVGQQKQVEQPHQTYNRQPTAYSPSYDQELPNYKSAPAVKVESNPKVYEHHYDYHHAPPKSQSHSDVSSSSHAEPPSYREHSHPQHHGGHDHSHSDNNRNYSSDDARHPTDGTAKPKMTKKSFAYYRKDNPKDDPNNHEYAEEYAQGNYRSFSTDYDSDRDGPSKST